MPEGTGLDKFRDLYPERFFDVGIAEAHALCFASGLAAQGIRPVVAVYSSFLQRAYDQIIEEIALQNAAIVLAIDRAGIVGGDGVTHQGIFDIAFLRNLPNFAVMAPKDAEELGAMLEFALTLNQPVSIRYPKDRVPNTLPAGRYRVQSSKLQLGKAEVLKEGKDFAIIALGSMVVPALEAIELLEKEGLSGTLINARFVKPLDTSLLKGIVNRNKLIFTVEEGVLEGGFGSAVMEALGAPIIRIGLPCEFITHGKREILLEKYGLTAQGIAAQIKMRLSEPGDIEKPVAKWQR